MDNKSFELLKQLSETPGVSGREERVVDLVRRSTEGLFDKTEVDAMGNLVALRKARPAKGGKKKAAGRRILVACHSDEIGFYVKYIDDKGFLRLNKVGGVDPRNLTSRNVLIQGRKDVSGVLYPAVKPLHLTSEEQRGKLPQVEEFYVDAFLPADEVKKLIRIGDPVTLQQDCRRVGPAVVGKAMDNRVALYVGIMAMRQAARRKHCPNELHLAATCQEEVGCRGAAAAAAAIAPDVAVAIDVTICADTPGMPPEDAVSQFGGGAAIKIMDSGSISNRELVDELIALAEREKIPHQLEILPRGGTDASAMQRAGSGCKAVTISVPCRYVHTACESVHTTDLQAAIDLLAAFLTE